MANRNTLGGVIHTYQKYDPARFPSPTQPPPDLVSPALEHMLMFGERRELTEEELARAIRLDPSQIAGLGPSIDALIAMLEERKRKILAQVRDAQRSQEGPRGVSHAGGRGEAAHASCARCSIASSRRSRSATWSGCGTPRATTNRRSPATWCSLIERLGDKYQVDELAAKYEFTGHESLTVPQALAVKEELEKIDELLKQLEEARKTAQIGIIDMDLLTEFAEPGDIEQLSALQQQIQDYLREHGRAAGPRTARGQLPAHAQGVSAVSRQAAGAVVSASWPRRGPAGITGPVVGEGAVELQTTKQYEFGDSIANLDIPGTFINALVRNGPGTPVRFSQDDIQVHRTRNTPKCATCVLMDMSGSMRYDGQYINVKRMALALEGLIRREYPGDWLRFVEMYTFAKLVEPGRIVNLMPKPVTVFDPVVRLRADMSRDDVSEHRIPPHFTNMQHGLSLARRLLVDRRHAEPADRADHRRPADRPLRRRRCSTCSTRPIRGPKRPRCAKAASASAKGSRSTCSCCPAGRKPRKTCGSPSAWPNRPPAGSSSPPAATSTATSSGTTYLTAGS